MKGEMSRNVLVAAVVVMVSVFLVFQAAQQFLAKAQDVNSDSRGNTQDNISAAACRADCLSEYPVGSSRLQSCRSRCGEG